MEIKGEGLEGLKKQLLALATKEVAVGIQSDTPKHKNGDNSISMVQLGAIHEFGTQISVTPKMRAYLGSQGLHLRKETTHINIPLRSFIRETVNVRQDEIKVLQRMLLEAVLDGRIDAETALSQLGLAVAGMMQERIAMSILPRNHPFTVARKGSTTTLIDSGQLRQSIRHKVRDKK